jgi:hypothetical protein
MTDKREYPLAVLVHSELCADVATLRQHGVTLIPMSTTAIAHTYPNGTMHNCYHVRLQTRGVVETVQCPPHQYEESTVARDDATMPLCAVCMGTHGVLDRLVMPPGIR